MSDDNRTARLALPLLAAGQAQKEITHNEALTMLDLLVQPGVSGVGVAVPAAPAIGSLWIVGTAPTGAWTGHASALAAWTAGGWRFADAVEGMTAWSVAERRAVQFVGGEWRAGEVRAGRVLINEVAVVGPQAGAIPAPAGGSVTDVEARTAIAAILVALRQHGLIAI